MTTSAPGPPPPRDPDELASALVDGLLAPDEAAAARRDPSVIQRAEKIQALRAALRDSPPPPAGAADNAVAAALAAFDAAPGPPRHLQALPGGGPPQLGRARSRRPGQWLAAAAVILVVGLVVAAVALERDSGDEETAATEATQAADDRAEMEEGAGDAAETDGNEGEDRDAATPAPEATQESGEAPMLAESEVPELGEIADPQELEVRVSTYLTAGYGSDPAGIAARSGAEEGPADCPGLSVLGDPDHGTTVFVADALYQDALVRVHVYDVGGEQRLVATDQSCVDVVDEAFGA
jgi:hypothetical protein